MEGESQPELMPNLPSCLAATSEPSALSGGVEGEPLSPAPSSPPREKVVWELVLAQTFYALVFMVQVLLGWGQVG